MDDKIKNDELDEKINGEMINDINADTDDDLVSPDKSIFTQVTGKINKVEKSSSYAATWHGANKEEEKFEVNESFAATQNADKNFMKAFGLSETGSHKTISSLEKTGKSQFSKGDIYSNDYEYTDISQKKEIVGMYNYATKVSLRKLIVALVFSVILFLQENIFQLELFDFQHFDYLNMDKHPYIHIIAGLVGIFICAICAREQLYHGARSIIKKDYSPESVSVIALLVAIVHSLVSCLFVAIDFDIKIMLFNFPASLILVISLLFTYFNVKRECLGFGVVSSKNPKFVLEKVQESNAEAEYDTFTTTSNGEFAGQIARVAKTPFVKNYFANSNSNVDIRKFLKVYYIIALAVPFTIAIVSAFLPEGRQWCQIQFGTVGWGKAYAAFVYFTIGILTVLPVGTLFSYSIPFLVANNNLFDSGVSIIGEDAILEFSKIDAIVVNDTTAFPPKNVKIKNIMGYNDYDIEKITYLAASGFSVVGGPLAEVFDAMLNNSVPKSSRAKFICSGRSHLSVQIDNHAVIFADKYGMTSQGIEVGSEREDKSDVSVMFMAVDGVLCSKMYIKYDINSEFLKTTKFINTKNMVLGVRTFDPNINNELLEKLSGISKKEIRVIKLTSMSDIPAPTHRCDGKIVSKGTSSALLSAIPTCKRIVKTRKVIKAIKVLSSLVGATYASLCIAGVIPVLFSGVIALSYLVFALIMYTVTVLMLPSNK